MPKFVRNSIIQLRLNHGSMSTDTFLDTIQFIMQHRISHVVGFFWTRYGFLEKDVHNPVLYTAAL